MEIVACCSPFYSSMGSMDYNQKKGKYLSATVSWPFYYTILSDFRLDRGYFGRMVLSRQNIPYITPIRTF